MDYYLCVLDKQEYDLLLEGLGDACDNAPDREREQAFNRLFDTVKDGAQVTQDVIRFYSLEKSGVGRVGNELVNVMRRLKECEEQGKASDVSWYTHELCAMVRGLAVAGWQVEIRPQSAGCFRCVEVEGMQFKV